MLAAFCHCPLFSHADMALLKLITSTVPPHLSRTQRCPGSCSPCKCTPTATMLVATGQPSTTQRWLHWT